MEELADVETIGDVAEIHDGVDELFENGEEDEEQSHELIVAGNIQTTGNRVNWHVALGRRKLPATFECPPFELDSIGPWFLRLRSRGKICSLELCGPPDRPSGFRVKLFVGKGWAKGSTREWPASEPSMSQDFGVSLSGRPTILA